jgi:predicted helicase
MVRTLYEQVATPGQLRPLGLVEVLDWASAALNRVDRQSFFARFDEGLAVQYFYEPFLASFDPEVRNALGVWYTPPEIVRFMVARVDRVLRDELRVSDGLADPNVYILDPCCGTGSYLVETLRQIAARLRRNGGDALVAQDLKHAALNRVFGFEILPAPFVIAHWQVGLLLATEGAPLGAEAERAAVYLTNALTGWQPAKEPKTRLLFPEMEAERDAAEHVKREVPILVVIGNPPYNAFAGTSPIEEEGLVEPYKRGLQTDWGIRKFNLDDLYIRFFRIAERRVAEMSGRGIVAYISNYSSTSEKSFVVMRRSILHNFDRIWIENMHGNRVISEYAPDGRTSETIFATSGLSVAFNKA